MAQWKEVTDSDGSPLWVNMDLVRYIEPYAGERLALTFDAETSVIITQNIQELLED